MAARFDVAPSTPAVRLIAALGLTRRATAAVQDLYSRPIAARPALVPVLARRAGPRLERVAA